MNCAQNKENFMSKYVEIGGIKVGYDYPPLVIAEIGINHNGSLTEAKKLVDAAKSAGIKVIKHQTHIPHEEMSVLAKNTIPGNSDKSIWDIMERCALSEADEIELKQYVEEQKMIFISTPFSFAAIERLERMNVCAYKIGSGEMNNYKFVKYIASKQKPIILSTGMNDLEAVKKAIECIEYYHKNYVILHTTNIYPTPAHLIRLGALNDLKKAFPEVPIGLSDHSLNNLSCLAAVALGACVLERHFTDTKQRIGEDIICSMTPEECHDLIRNSHEIFLMRNGHKEASKEEAVTIKFAFSTLIANKDLECGHILEESDIATKRPYVTGILAKDIDKVIGKKIIFPLKKGQHLEWSDIE